MHVTIADFEAALAAKTALGLKAVDDIRTLQAELDARILAMFQAAFPKSKITDLDKIQKKIDVSAIDAEYKALAKEVGDRFWEQADAAEAQLVKMAAVLSPPLTGELEMREKTRHNDYRSQGYGANGYARAQAERRATDAIRAGLNAEVRLIDSGMTGGPHSLRWEDYGVFANTTETGWEILTRKPPLPIREWLKECWKAGVNPRVMNPYLPHDLEERLGVNYDGSDCSIWLAKQGVANDEGRGPIGSPAFKAA